MTASTNTGGSITPSGTTVVNHGDSLTYKITPSYGYEIKSLIVDGVNVGKQDSYTFNNITGSHTIQVVFALKKYDITASCNLGGNISPKGTTAVEHGSSITYTIIPNYAFEVQSVIVDGVDKGILSSYTFGNVTDPHTIQVVFKSSSKLEINDFDLFDSKGNNLSNNTIKSGYGIFTESDLLIKYITGLKVEVSYNFGDGDKTIALEDVNGVWQFIKNFDSALKHRCIYIPVAAKDKSYTVTLKISGIASDGKPLSDSKTATVTVKGSMHDDDFTGDS